MGTDHVYFIRQTVVEVESVNETWIIASCDLAVGFKEELVVEGEKCMERMR